MRILFLILQSIRQELDHGGSSKNLRAIAANFGFRGHDVRILCAKAVDNSVPFELSSNVRVLPLLPYRESWQDTWYVTPADLARIATIVQEQSAESERIVVFDSHFPYPDLFPADVPTIWSLRDYTYVHALQGSLAFRRDVMIAPSDFIRNAFCDAIGAVLPGLANRVIVVRNGVDVDVYTPRHNALNAGMSPQSASGPVLLFPHRPEEAKGFGRALEICRRLADGAFPRVVLQFFRGVDAATRPEVQRFYDDVRHRIEALGLSANVRMDAWVPPHAMPEQYARANATLCVGDIVEASSNSALESMAVGTPVVAFDIGCFRELPGVIRSPAGNVDDVVENLTAILKGQAGPDWHRTNAELNTLHGFSRMLDEFHDAIVGARVLPPLDPRDADPRRLKIPVWISPQGLTLYDEYRRVSTSDGDLQKLWDQHGYSRFFASSSDLVDWDGLIRSGLLVKTH